MKKVGNGMVVIGTGSAGISYAYSTLNQAFCDDLVLIDFSRKRAEDEARDFRHGVPYVASSVWIYVGDYGDCPDADTVCTCAGLPRHPGETRPDLIDNNLYAFHSIVTAAMASGSDGVPLVATNSVDVLSYATWRFSGLSKERVIGPSMIIDSACPRSCLSNEFNVAPWSVDAMTVGKRSDSVIAVWSTVNISGISVKEILEREEGGKARMEKIYSNVCNAAYEVIEAKGSTSRGIGTGLSRISNTILHNQGVVLPMSSLLEGEFGQENVYIGVSTVVSRQGTMRTINLDLSDDEAGQLVRSAELLKSYQRRVDGFMAVR